MPCLKILTNISKENIPREFIPKLVVLLSELVRKEPERFLCVVEGGCPISIGGNMELPGIVATLESIGNLGPEHNKRIMKGLAEFAEKELHVKPARFFLTFYDLKNYNVGISGTTVDAL